MSSNNTKSIKNIIFDVNDVLTMHRNGKEWSNTVLAEESGVSLQTVKDFFTEYIAAGRETFGLSLEDFWPKKTINTETITLATIKSSAQRYDEDIIVNSEMVEILKKLKPRYRLFALTNAWKPGHAFKNSLERHFEAFVQSCDINLLKPDPAAFQYMLTTYNLLPEETLFIDNRIENVTAARTIGIHAFQFTTVDSFTDNLREFNIQF